MQIQSFKRALDFKTIAVAVSGLVLGAIVFSKFAPKPDVESVKTIVVDTKKVEELQGRIDSLTIVNTLNEDRAMAAERNVDIIARQIDKLTPRYRDARTRKDTGQAFAICDTIVRENERLLLAIDSNKLATHLLLAGKKAEINTQKVLIDTLNGQVKQLSLENTRLVGIANENAKQAKKLNNRLRASQLLNKVLAGVIVAAGIALSIN